MIFQFLSAEVSHKFKLYRIQKISPIQNRKNFRQIWSTLIKCILFLIYLSGNYGAYILKTIFGTKNFSNLFIVSKLFFVCELLNSWKKFHNIVLLFRNVFLRYKKGKHTHTTSKKYFFVIILFFKTKKLFIVVVCWSIKSVCNRNNRHGYEKTMKEKSFHC